MNFNLVQYNNPSIYGHSILGYIQIKGHQVPQNQVNTTYSTAAHTDGPAWFVMCNIIVFMCVMMTEI